MTKNQDPRIPRKILKVVTSSPRPLATTQVAQAVGQSDYVAKRVLYDFLADGKVSRFRSVASQQKLLNAIEEQDGRINLSWGSNMIIQVAAGYADAAVEFTKGFATYDVLPGLFIGLKSGLTILDPRSGQPIECKLDIDDVWEGRSRTAEIRKS